jgi:hypothetical protein
VLSGSLDGPFPGDLVQARQSMRAWESEWDRGVNGPWIQVGQVALVLRAWTVSTGRPVTNPSRTRLWALFNDRVAMFSCETVNFGVNWQVIPL